MAAPSVSSAGYRLLVVSLLLLVLAIVYAGYLRVQNEGLKSRNQYVTNNYKTVRDSVRHAPAVRIVRTPAPPPVVLYRPSPPTPAQLTALRQALASEVITALRRELARQAPRPAVVTLKQAPMVLALKDTMVIRHKPGTNQLTVSPQKTGAFQDKWLSLTTVIRPGRAGRPDSMEVKYQLRNEYDVAAWVKRERGHRFWPFRRKRIYVTLVSKNPNAVDTGLESIPVNKAKKVKK